jgi:hypothetical protein
MGHDLLMINDAVPKYYAPLNVENNYPTNGSVVLFLRIVLLSLSPIFILSGYDYAVP